MAGIKQPIQDILNKLLTLQITNMDGNAATPHVRIWNNQVRYEHNREQVNFPKPAVFVEVINKVHFEEIGIGFRSADLGINIHLVHEFYDATDGTMEQDMAVFDLRDQVLVLLSNYQPTACSPLNSTGEEQDYEHSNVYHYIIGFVCNFTDSKGSPYDQQAGKYIDSNVPTTMQVTITETK